MPKLGETTGLDQKFIEDAAKWYRENHIPQAFRDLPKILLKEVKRLSGGQWNRCVVDEFGSVTIYNNPQWQRTPNHPI